MQAAIVLLLLSVVIAAAALFYIRSQVAEINRVAIAELDNGVAAGEAMNVLLVGSDSRERVSGDLAEQTGKTSVQGRRSDTIMVLRIDPGQGKAMILSIPRDLYVTVAGTGRKDRVNSAFSLSGATGLVATVESALGISINHYVEVDFVGFRDIVDAVGGVKVYVPAPARDRYSGLSLSAPGCIRLNGTQSLAWVRSRYYETMVGGRWRADPTSDIGRIGRQQDFIRRMMRTAVDAGLTNPVKLNRLVGIGVRDVTLDVGMSTKDVITIARSFRSFDPTTVDMVTLPTRTTSVRGASVEILLEDQAKPLIDRLNGVGVAPAGVSPAPSSVPAPASSPSTTTLDPAASC